MAGKKNKTVMVVQQPQPAGNKTARNRRRRQKKRMNRTSIAKAARMPVSKISRWPKSAAGAAFVRAALDPFSDQALPAVGVPDGLAGKTLKHTNTMSFTVSPTVDGSQVRLVLVPSASTPIAMIEGIFSGVEYPTFDGATLVGTGTASDPITTVGSGSHNIPCLAWPYWAQYYGSQAGTITSDNAAQSESGPYQYKSQRIVGYGLEWRYTGTTLADQGVATCAVLDAYAEEGYLEFPYSAGGFPGGLQNVPSINFVQRADLTVISDVSQQSLSNVPGYVQQTLKAAEGSGGMSVSVNGEANWKMDVTKTRMWLMSMGARTEDIASALVSRMYTYGLTTGTPPNVQCAAPLLPWQNLRPIGLVISGLTPSMTFEVRVIQYIEATIATSSPFQQFTSVSPAEDQDALCLVATVSKSLPCMVPVTMNSFGEWWQKIMGKINSLGNIVRGMGIPVASQIAGGVGDIAGILGSFASM